MRTCMRPSFSVRRRRERRSQVASRLALTAYLVDASASSLEAPGLFLHPFSGAYLHPLHTRNAIRLVRVLDPCKNPPGGGGACESSCASYRRDARATNRATRSASPPTRMPGGIRPEPRPPFAIAARTRAAVGRNRLRFGPAGPVVPGGRSGWQEPQFPTNSSAAGARRGGGGGAATGAVVCGICVRAGETAWREEP